MKKRLLKVKYKNAKGRGTFITVFSSSYVHSHKRKHRKIRVLFLVYRWRHIASLFPSDHFMRLLISILIVITLN